MCDVRVKSVVEYEVLLAYGHSTQRVERDLLGLS